MSEASESTALVVREPSRLDELARLGTWLAASESGDTSAKGKGATAALGCTTRPSWG